MFTMGIADSLPWFGTGPAGIPVYRMTREEVDRDRGRVLNRLPVPPGRTVSYPYMVKIDGEGEYWVRSDGTATYYSYRAGRWEPPQVVNNRSIMVDDYDKEK
jgi:hypothetical protein